MWDVIVKAPAAAHFQTLRIDTFIDTELRITKIARFLARRCSELDELLWYWELHSAELNPRRRRRTLLIVVHSSRQEA